MSDSDGVYRPSSKRQVLWSWVLIVGVVGLFWGYSVLDDDRPSGRESPPCDAQVRGGTDPC
ncbi:hypothetical protein ACFWVP_16665 [Streptomyces sp. NPDC058637]|uniref:hypothetical protein n=1 Tax=Streptomyces sp. NPDC058637 TaxID=3346569 RepID=UPI0036607FA8